MSSRITALSETIESNPLLVKASSQSGINGTSLDELEQPNMYFGTGLSTTKAMSRGFPFDLMTMVTVAELLRRKLGLGKIIHEISDTHSLTNEFVSADTVKALSRSQMDLMQIMTKRLGLEGVYEPTLASTYQAGQEYRDLKEQMDQIAPEAPEYARFQWAGMSWLRDQQDVMLKLGWLIDEKSKGGFDERYFDNGFPQKDGLDMSFSYVGSGKNFIPDRARVSPYTSPEGEKRIMMQPDFTNAVEFLEPFIPTPGAQPKKWLRTALNQLDETVNLFEELFGEVSGKTLGEKINAVMGESFGMGVKESSFMQPSRPSDDSKTMVALRR